jgi:NADH dehydrogenase FAD-containing subunit
VDHRFLASPLAARSGLAVDERGRILVHATLRSVSDPAVLAIGDAAAFLGSKGGRRARRPAPIDSSTLGPQSIQL